MFQICFANAVESDHVEDLSGLRHLNESSCLHVLRQRYGNNLVHTYAGAAVVVVNPMTQLSIYSDKVAQMFRGCKAEDMPPHIYAVAQRAYVSMLTSRRDQAVVFLGRSGSGKTTNAFHALQYLLLAADRNGKAFTVEKMQAVQTVLETFGHSRTVMNCNASRFTQVFVLDFDASGQLASASVQVRFASGRVG
ncbi:unnamed protein product, partial [Darwinula stevensoni]